MQLSRQTANSFEELNFANFDDFASFHLSQPFSCHYEIIKGQQNAYFDIDQPTQVDVDVVVKRVVDYFGEQRMAVLAYSSSDTKKTSYHVVLRGLHFASHVSCGLHAKRALTGQAGFDDCVYTSVRKFRLLGSRKIDSTRVKRFVKVVNFGYYTADEVERLTTDAKFCLQQSLVSYVDVDRSMPIVDVVDDSQRNRTSTTESQRWTTDNMREAVSLVNDMMPGVYIVRDLSTDGNILNLKRAKPARCPLCERVHENEGAFVVKKSTVYLFFCRRKEGEHIVLGDDDDEITIPVIDEVKLDSIGQLVAKCRQRCGFY